MTRVILFLMLFGALTFAATAALAWMRQARTVALPASGPLPPALRRAAYPVLIVLLSGLALGWIGS